MELTTDRLFIRPITIADKEDLLAYRSDAITNQYQGWIPSKLSDVEKFIGKLSPTPNLPNTWYQLGIVERKSNKFIGDVGIHFIDPKNYQAEVGCTLDKNYQGQGFALEALRKVIDYLFTEYKKHRIIASIDPDNLSSIILVERLGFRKEAHFKESLMINNQWVDDIIYAILAKEWRSSAS